MQAHKQCQTGLQRAMAKAGTALAPIRSDLSFPRGADRLSCCFMKCGRPDGVHVERAVELLHHASERCLWSTKQMLKFAAACFTEDLLNLTRRTCQGSHCPHRFVALRTLLQ